MIFRTSKMTLKQKLTCLILIIGASVIAFSQPSYAIEFGYVRTSGYFTQLNIEGGTALNTDPNNFLITPNQNAPGNIWNATFIFAEPLNVLQNEYISFSYKIRSQGNGGPNNSMVSTYCLTPLSSALTTIDCDLEFSNTSGGSGDASYIGTSATIVVKYVLRANYYISNLSYISFNGNLLMNASKLFPISLTTSRFFVYQDNADLHEIKEILQDMQENSASEQLQESRDEADQAQQQTETDGSQSQQDADSSGQTLLGALTSFVGALNASPGNCSITLNTGYGFNMGAVNLCSISPPSSFQVISSIVVIGFAVPLSIAASKKMIELFRSFQT